MCILLLNCWPYTGTGFIILSNRVFASTLVYNYWAVNTIPAAALSPMF